MPKDERTEHEKLVARVKALNGIYRGSEVQHFRNKKRYKISTFTILCDSANPENDGKALVTYRNSEGVEYSRGVKEFFGEVENAEGKAVRRFSIQREIMW